MAPIKGLIKFWTPSGILSYYRRVRNPALLPLPHVPLLLPIRVLDDLFPGINGVEISIPAAQLIRPSDMFLPLVEMMTIGAICKQAKPRRIFEIGTFTGSTTLTMALATPPETEIYTLDLPPRAPEVEKQTEATVGSAFRNTPSAAKIRQVFGDSRTFDFTPFAGRFDLVFVDANHTYAYVQADTQSAFKMIRPGGVIVWDDYVWDARHPEVVGVARCLNELVKTKPCFQIDGTRLAIYIDLDKGADTAIEDSGNLSSLTR